MPSSDIDMRAEERAVIIEAANLVARSARSRAQWSKEIRNAISVSDVVEWAQGLGIYVKVDLSAAPMARAFEKGSGIHATIGEAKEYDIVPVNKEFLSFIGTHGYGSLNVGNNLTTREAMNRVFTKHVSHPGVAPRPYLAPAVQENRDRIRGILSQAVRTSVSRTIRQSWYHSE